MPKVPKHYSSFPPLQHDETSARAVLHSALQRFCHYYRKRKHAGLVIQRAWLFSFRMNSVQRIVLRYNACKINLASAEKCSLDSLRDQVQSAEFVKLFSKCVQRIYDIFHSLYKTGPKQQCGLRHRVLLQAFLMGGQPKKFFSGDAMYRDTDSIVQAARKFLECFDFICKMIEEGPKTLNLKALIFSRFQDAENFGSFLFMFQDAYQSWKEYFVQFNVNQLRFTIREHYILLQRLAPCEKLYQSEQYQDYVESISLNKKHLAAFAGQAIANIMDIEIQCDVSSRVSGPFLFYYMEKTDMCSVPDLFGQILLDSSFLYSWISCEDWYTKSIFHIVMYDLTVFNFPNCYRILNSMNKFLEKMEREPLCALFAEEAKKLWDMELIQVTMKNQKEGGEILTFFSDLYRQTLDLMRNNVFFMEKEYVKNALNALDTEYDVQPRTHQRLMLYLCLCVQKMFVLLKQFQIDHANQKIQQNLQQILNTANRYLLDNFEENIVLGKVHTVNFKSEFYGIVDTITKENPSSFRTIFATSNFSEYCNSLVVANLVIVGPSLLCKSKLPETLCCFYRNLHYAHEKIDFFVKVTSMAMRLHSCYSYDKNLKNQQPFEVCMQPVVDLCIMALEFSNKKGIVMTQSAFTEEFMEAVKRGFQLQPSELEFIRFHFLKTFSNDDCVAKLQKTRMSKMLTQYVLGGELANVIWMDLFRGQILVLFEMVKKISKVHFNIFSTRISDTVLERVMVYQ